MYKCICSNVTVGQIQAELDKGLTLEEAYAILNVGANCGTCIAEELRANIKSNEDTEQ